MPPSCCSFRSLGKAPSLSAITHDSNPKSFEDGIFLPSSCHNRTWLLGNFQETYSEASTHQPAACKQHPCKVEPGVQSSWISGADRTTRSSSKTHGRATCQSGISPAVPECASQPCQSRNCQQVGFVVQSYQPASYMAKCHPLKSTMSESCQTVEFETSQCYSQVPESSSCNSSSNVVFGTQLVESSSSYEPACCVTGGSQMPSK
ncbi:keratin-associated protein 27-1 [Phodopus roborovskii]|uniref:Keratin-associated protein n=1 Tax=Phodopus roborovskii TaxID=109678 RepID=A0AAU9ZMH7_PHORO|nr:keratin-associated protein 27-1 [Phodopus roborovskii]CAH6792510.1 Krtap27-1 [Phodopus roborovskii]